MIIFLIQLVFLEMLGDTPASLVNDLGYLPVILTTARDGPQQDVLGVLSFDQHP